MPELYLGAIYDAMRELGFRVEQFYINIKPKAGFDHGIVSGPALTTHGRVVASTENYQQLDNIRLGLYKKEYFTERPVVLLEANDDKVAHSGDITSQIYQALGSCGFVTDGNVRDPDKIDQLNYPVFCKDLNPIDAIDYWALTEFQKPITLEHVLITPGDRIFLGTEGVIRVPQSIHKEFLLVLEKVISKEKKVRSMIKDMVNSDQFIEKLNDFVEKEGRW